jgi:hypothetical protein
MLNPRALSISKFVLLILVSFCACSRSTAQPSHCSLKLDQLKDTPELFGFRLGMNFDQIKARSSLIKFGRPDKFGVVKTTINPHYEPRFEKTTFPDVRTISLDFLDGRLVTLWIGYEATFKWPKLDEFVANVSKSLDVPADWPVKRNGRQLYCDGFSVFASIIARGPSIRITDEVAQSVIADRREKAAESEDAEVVGDTRTLSYYPSDCSAKDGVPAPRRTTFRNKTEAESAGYKLARGCQ